MSQFFDLFARASAAPGPQPDPGLVDAQFAELVRAGPLRLWSPGDSVPDRGTRLLVGVATWSGYDMRLLDVVAEGVSRDWDKAPVVEVFNVADCRDVSDFKKFVPGLRRVH